LKKLKEINFSTNYNDVVFKMEIINIFEIAFTFYKKFSNKLMIIIFNWSEYFE
jgi:hypothetical protein